MDRVINLNQKASFTELGEESKNDFQKDLFELDEQCSTWENYGECEKT